jgi:hypothetical protein
MLGALCQVNMLDPAAVCGEAVGSDPLEADQTIGLPWLKDPAGRFFGRACLGSINRTYFETGQRSCAQGCCLPPSGWV